MRRLLPVVLLAVGLAAGLATACSKSTDPQVATAGGPQPTAVATDPAIRLHQYASCLRDHGLRVDDPAPADAGVRLNPQDPPEKVAQAIQACMQFAGDDAAQKPPTAAELAALRTYAKCMRDHNVPSFPDPDPQSGFFTGLTKENYNPNDPTVKTALAACQSLAPTAQPGG